MDFLEDESVGIMHDTVSPGSLVDFIVAELRFRESYSASSRGIY